jgi:prepilin-type N-terminal cleavage/methylation domain-containing protein
MKGRSSKTGVGWRGVGPEARAALPPYFRVGRPGFTLIETIVAVTAVALVAVGLASIFDAVGKTVKGGKRVSLLNQYATLVENQMRSDFSRMTRDGFMLIRHEWADGDADGRFDPADDALPLHPEDDAPRPRRVDQILFFANGRFETARQPVDPNVRVTSDTAMIYYGHGQKRRVDGGRFLRPDVDDDNANVLESRLGHAPSGESAGANPNYHPADWSLIRHATMLVKPSSSGINRAPIDLRFGAETLPPERLRDYDYQIGLQPAARSVFRALNRFYPRQENGSLPAVNRSFRPTVARSRLASGLVDIAATDLREIRATVEGLVGGRDYLPEELFDPSSSEQVQVESLFVPWEWVEPNTGPVPGTPTALDMMHVWMQQAFPTQGASGPAFGSTDAEARLADPWGVRMRVESEPIGLLESLRQPTTAESALELAVERLDKIMLAGNTFLPRCSEFIVEWSFGLVDPNTNRTIWYGPESRDAGGRWVSRAYPNVLGEDPAQPTPPPQSLVIEVARLQGWILVDDCPRPAPPQPDRPAPRWLDADQIPRSATVWPHVVTPKLIYGRNPLNNRYEPSETLLSTTAHFGYGDPTFKQDRLRWVAGQPGQPPGFFPADPSRDPGDGGDGIADYGRQVDLDCDGVIEPDEALGGEPASASAPWPWPRLIRVTMTVSDAQDPSVENTFQFIFGVPADPSRKDRS